MEGDAGASRLNPTDADDSLPTEVTAEDSGESEVGTDQISTEVTAEDSGESGVGTDQISTEVTAEDSEESGVGADASQANTEDADSSAEASPEPDKDSVPESLGVERGPSRLGRGWLVGITAALLLAALGFGAGSYFALRSHRESQALARNDAAAIQAAKDCVAATQAPDTSSMAASEQKIIDCGTDEFRTQALLYSGVLVQTYQAANVHVQVSDERAAIERNDSDGSVDVLIALRVKASSDQAQPKESGYRLRVKMTPVDGQYKISKLEQVTK